MRKTEKIYRQSKGDDMKYCFIINPAAGKSVTKEGLEERIIRACEDKGVDGYVLYTERAGDMQRCIAQFCEEHVGEQIRFYACGGDGTLNEAVNGVMALENREGVSLGVLPVGTGNDFVRSFSPEGDFLSLEDQIAGKSIKIDSVSAGESIFVNMLNVGFDSAVVSTISKLRDKSRLMRGQFAYVISVAINFFKMPKTRLSCEFDDGEKVEGEFLLSAFSNGQYYGGGFKAGADAKLDDGLLDVLFVKPCPRLVFLSLISKYKKGTLLEDPKSEKYVIFKKCRSLKASFSEDSYICVDGEIVDEHTFNIEMLPGTLKFSLPGKEK
jgi:YegS/Rv2252/BmrU family lipid kinase